MFSYKTHLPKQAHLNKAIISIPKTFTLRVNSTRHHTSFYLFAQGEEPMKDINNFYLFV